MGSLITSAAEYAFLAASIIASAMAADTAAYAVAQSTPIATTVTATAVESAFCIVARMEKEREEKFLKLTFFKSVNVSRSVELWWSYSFVWQYYYYNDYDYKA